MPTPKFKILKSSDDHVYWNLYAPNNEVILTSELYTTRTSALNGIASTQANADDDTRYDRRASHNGKQLYFVLTAKNGEVLGTSEMYESKAAREEGIEAVKRSAPGAEIEG